MQQRPAVAARPFQSDLTMVSSTSRQETIRIASWNVNSLKARRDHVLSYLIDGKADILLLQELKLQNSDFPHEAFEEIGFSSVCHGQRAYNGVAIISRFPIENIVRGLPGAEAPAGLDGEADTHARYVQADIRGVTVASLYLPNGNPCPGPRFEYKLRWMARLASVAETLKHQEARVVLGGDYNVIPQDLDCYDSNAWDGDALWHPDSRAAFFTLSHSGYTDALRAIHPLAEKFSFWDYQAGAWQKNNGIRIDHLMLSPEAASRLKYADIDAAERGKERPSDHTPVYCDIKMPA